jgi:TonB-dependent SusC/RagA subfamily outer membrane receptor
MKETVLFDRINQYKTQTLSSLILVVLTVCSAVAQDRQITGKVTESQGASVVPGTNITIKGTTTGTVSNADGTYTITVRDNTATLVFSSVGYTSQDIAVGAKSVIDVDLVPDIKALNEVVVVGYGTQQRKDITGAISSVSAAQIEKVPVTTLDQALQGRSPGVQVTNNDGSPGGGVSVQIRGTGTFGDNSPLYVVDGYPISGGLNTLNPNDIASMEILKDASATAIYGNRASNGVVIVTTKRGKQGALQVSFDAYGSMQAIPKL